MRTGADKAIGEGVALLISEMPTTSRPESASPRLPEDKGPRAHWRAGESTRSRTRIEGNMTVVDTRSSWFRNYTTIRTNAFACIVSTAPGLFRPSVLILPVGPDGEQKGWPLAKAYLPRLYFSKKARNIVHDYIVNVLDNSGQDKTKSIGYTLEGVFWVAKTRGYIVDYIIAPSAKGDPGSRQDFLAD